MKKINLLSLVPILVFIGLLGYIFYTAIADQKEDVHTLQQLDKTEPIDLQEYVGKGKTILHFVAVPCECCSYTMPFIKKFIDENPDFHLVTIVFSGKENEIRERFKEYDVHHPWGIDLDQKIAQRYKVTVSPTFVFLNEKGEHLGSHPYVIADHKELLKLYEQAESNLKR